MFMLRSSLAWFYEETFRWGQAGLRRFRDLFRRNELQPDISDDGKDLLDGMEP